MEKIDRKNLLAKKSKKKKLQRKTFSTAFKGLDKMSAKVAAALSDSSNNSTSTATGINITTVAATSSNTGGVNNNATNANGTTTPGRRLRTRNSNSSGNLSGSDSTTKKHERGATAERNNINYVSDSNSNAATMATSSNHSNSSSSMADDKPPGSNSNAAASASKKYHNPCPHPGNTTRKTQPHTQPHSSSTFVLSKNEEFNFDAPMECPVFRPTTEEFKNPLAYINKIRPIAEKCGIAKIRPPDFWSPPFAVDVDKLKFTPRVQRLNELEAKTRVKLNFLDQIAKFWELQGSSLKIPMVERKALDLYTLHRIVQEEGGMEQTTKDRKWAKVANRMSYPSSKSVGATLKAHYERILHPFEVYTSGKVLGNAGSSAAGSGVSQANVSGQEVKLEDGTDYKAHEIPTRQQIAPPNENNARRSKRFANSSANCGLGAAKGGVGVGGGCSSSSASSGIKCEKKEDFKRDLLHAFNNNTAARFANSGASGKNNTGNEGGNIVDPLMKYICHICNRGDVEEAMLLCDGCDDSYHTFCLLPPLSSIPKGEWLCPRCVVEEVSKPQEAFGFEQAEREYTLQQFGQMADQFKMDYFRKPVHMVPTDLVEREFWRIVSSIDEDVTVEYGADLHTMDHGSGFPTKSSLHLLPSDQEYAESSWNLNNLPLLEDSILGHINADISGMNAPWMYVGMCFAAFCWHNEDHWSYSINYLHWGEPKTWYGVPGSCAEKFEETMKKAAPELFASQPDLLHQLVTIMNPNILMNNGVPVYRTDQNAGEFVITFPRAYHAGFNQGYNFAEAVNFAPADWLRSGRECVNHYSMLRRFCVFSHDELVCKMALEPAKLTFGIATACYIDMADMVDSEKKLRKSLLEWGVTRAERKAFELVPDDERHCHECNTTCFLSAVSCECTKSIACLRHYTVLCTCPPEKHTLLYRYTLDEMPLMLQKLKAKAESFERWLSRCRDIIDPSTPTTVSLIELQELCKEAESKKYPSSLLIDRLNASVLEAEKCVTVIQQLGINKVRTRSDNNLEAAQYKLTMEELELFVQEIDNLCCIIEEGVSVRELLVLGKQFVERADAMLKLTLDAIDEQELETLINEGNSLRIELSQMQQLNARFKQLKWYKRSQGMRNANNKISYKDIHNLLHNATGEIVPTDPIIDKEMRKLHEIGAAIEVWEKQAAHYFNNPIQQQQLLDIEEFLKTATDIEGQVPSHTILKEGLRKVREWLRSVEQLQMNGDNNHYPLCHMLESIVQRGRSIPIKLEELSIMQSHLNGAYEWRDSTSRAFLKRPTWYTLLEVLMPRTESVLIDCDLKKPFEDDFVKEMSPAQVVEKFKIAENHELRDMRELRRQNIAKNPMRDHYCLCKSNFHGIMYNCQLCCDWFHEECMQNSGPPPVPLNSKCKWLCPSCVRSKRPRLETILPLLVSLQKLPIRLPEDEALRCLAERAMSWQDRARKILASPDVAAAIDVINLHQRKQKRKNSSNCQQMTQQQQQQRKARRASQRTPETASDHADSDDDDEGRLHIVEDGFSNDEDDQQQHINQNNQQDETLTELQRLLSGSETENLDELMMEGDLLEVSLDETQELWRILSIVRPTATPDAALLVEQQAKYNISQNNVALLNNSAVNSAAEDSNDSLIVQSSPNSSINNSSSNNNNNNNNNNNSTNSNSTRQSNNSNSVGRKRRSTENTMGVRKRNATPSKYQNGRKNSRKSYEGGNKSTAAAAAASASASALSTTTTNSNTNDSNTGGDIFTQTKYQGNCNNSNNNSVTSNTSSSSSSTTTTTTNSTTNATTTHKKRKRTSGNNGANNNNNNNSSSSSSSGQQYSSGGTTTGQKKNAQRNAQMTQQEDDEEECRAENCHKPTGREVDWVQCDGGCNEWFHMYCVGLNRSQIKADDDYICVRCSKKQSSPIPHTSGTGFAANSTTTAIATSSSSIDDVTSTNSINLYNITDMQTIGKNSNLNNVTSTTNTTMINMINNNNNSSNISGSNNNNNNNNNNSNSNNSTNSTTAQQYSQIYGTTTTTSTSTGTTNIAANNSNNNNNNSLTKVTTSRVQSTVR